jgi:hypothetical protein
MKQFGLGRYLTANGHEAFIDWESPVQSMWALRGGVYSGDRLILTAYWARDGKCSRIDPDCGWDLLEPWIVGEPSPTDTLNREALSHAIVLITQHAVSIRGVARRHSFAKSNEERLDREADHLEYAAATLEKLVAKEGI